MELLARFPARHGMSRCGSSNIVSERDWTMKTRVIARHKFLSSDFASKACRGISVAGIAASAANNWGRPGKILSPISACLEGAAHGWQQENSRDSGWREHRIGVWSGALGKARCHADA